jgi:hypothetical protein
MIYNFSDIVIATLAIIFIVETLVGYFQSSEKTVWQRLLASAKCSATILWARFVTLVTAAVGGLVWLADLVNEPTLAAAITSYLTPRVVAVIFVGSALISAIARRRTLNT